MKVLVFNAGSSSLKFNLINMPGEERLAKGLFERIGLKSGNYKIKYGDGKEHEETLPIEDHAKAFEILLDKLVELKIIDSLKEIDGIGHRVLIGGEYSGSVIVDDEVKQNIKDYFSIGPLHNPANLTGILAAEKSLVGVPNVAVFDNAFHQTLSKVKYMYPIPLKYFEKYKIRKYGYHGTSFKYITNYMKKFLNKDKVNLIICHIGNGASICCVKDSKSYDTSMGFTPLTGLMMGTRSGDVDPSVVTYIMNKENKTADEVLEMLNKKSGLLGLSGISSDSRDVEEAINKGNKDAKLAEEVYIDRIISYIARYYFDLEGQVDSIVLTAGVGENAKQIRAKIIERLNFLGIELDEELNNVRGEFSQISTGDSSIPVYVVPTDEELEIARDVYELLY